MRAELANLNDCAVLFLSRAASCAGTTIHYTVHNIHALQILGIIRLRIENV